MAAMDMEHLHRILPLILVTRIPTRTTDRVLKLRPLPRLPLLDTQKVRPLTSMRVLLLEEALVMRVRPLLHTAVPRQPTAAPAVPPLMVLRALLPLTVHLLTVLVLQHTGVLLLLMVPREVLHRTEIGTIVILDTILGEEARTVQVAVTKLLPMVEMTEAAVVVAAVVAEEMMITRAPRFKSKKSLLMGTTKRTFLATLAIPASTFQSTRIFPSALPEKMPLQLSTHSQRQDFNPSSWIMLRAQDLQHRLPCKNIHCPLLLLVGI